MTERRPKPLVEVWRFAQGEWRWACRRCGAERFSEKHEVSLRRGVEHVVTHLRTGFQPPLRKDRT